MVILFAPSEGKRPGGTGEPLCPGSLLFPELYSRRLEMIRLYEAIVSLGDETALSELFGLKDTGEFDRYKVPFAQAATMKAILRYDGVAYDYLDYPTLDPYAQEYVDRHVIVFSNLFGPIGAGDSIPDYKLKQGSAIGEAAPETFYRREFTEALDELIGEREVLDIRAGFYDKFYVPKNRPVTMKFLKEGKALSHWAKAYRGKVLRQAAISRPESVDELLSLDIEGLKLEEIRETKKSKEIVYSIC